MCGGWLSCCRNAKRLSYVEEERGARCVGVRHVVNRGACAAMQRHSPRKAEEPSQPVGVGAFRMGGARVREEGEEGMTPT